MLGLPARFAALCAAPVRMAAALPRPVVAGERPEIPLLGPPPTRIENRRRRLVDEQLRRAQQLLAHQPPEGPDLGGGIAGPEGQGRPLDRDALPRQDLGLAIERAVVG